MRAYVHSVGMLCGTCQILVFVLLLLLQNSIVYYLGVFLHSVIIYHYFHVLFRPVEDVAPIRILERRWITSLRKYLFQPMSATFLTKCSWRHVGNKYGARWKSTDSVTGTRSISCGLYELMSLHSIVVGVVVVVVVVGVIVVVS